MRSALSAEAAYVVTRLKNTFIKAVWEEPEMKKLWFDFYVKKGTIRFLFAHDEEHHVSTYWVPNPQKEQGAWYGMMFPVASHIVNVLNKNLPSWRVEIMARMTMFP